MSKKEILKTFEEFSEAVLPLVAQYGQNTDRQQQNELYNRVKQIRVAYLKGAKGAVDRRLREEQMNKLHFLTGPVFG